KKLAWLKPQIPKQERHMFSNYLKYFTALLLTATFSTAVAADEQLSKIEKAYQAVDAATLTTLIEAAQGNNQFVAQYRLLSLKMGSNQMDQAHSLLTKLKSDLEAETKANPGNAEAWALLSSTYGMLTTMEQDKVMEYGRKSGEAEGQALAAGWENPMVMLLTGINKFYTPEEWGGGKAKALEYFDRAVTAYEAGTLDRAWGHADALVWRGTTHSELGDITKAKADINSALAMEPDYQWAKNALGNL